jgi:hypothetical protein
MKNNPDFVVNPHERHTIVCGVCGKSVKPDSRNPFLFFGFKCTDTNLFVGFECRKKYYKEKNLGKYGIKHMNKISETPVPVPWRSQPLAQNIGEQLTIKF